MKVFTTFKYQPRFLKVPLIKTMNGTVKNLEHNKSLKMPCRDYIYFPTI